MANECLSRGGAARTTMITNFSSTLLLVRLHQPTSITFFIIIPISLSQINLLLKVQHIPLSFATQTVKKTGGRKRAREHRTMQCLLDWIIQYPIPDPLLSRLAWSLALSSRWCYPIVNLLSTCFWQRIGLLWWWWCPLCLLSWPHTENNKKWPNNKHSILFLVFSKPQIEQ